MTYRHITILSCLAFILSLAFAHGANAALTCPKLPSDVKIEDVENSWIALQVPIPNVTFTCTDDNDTPENATDDVTKDYVKDMGAYIGGLYKYFVGVIGIIAAVMVFYGGLQWLTAAGNASRVKGAKETIFAALIAIVIAFGSYLLLYTINPKLVQINPPVLRVADTFLMSFDNSCPTSKYCLSGTNVGNPCTSIAQCPNASTGGCELPLEEETGENVTFAECGVRYKFKDVLGMKNSSKTCIGQGCRDGYSCAKGTIEDELAFDIPDAIAGIGTHKVFKTDPKSTQSYCVIPSLICQSVRWKDTDKSTCAKYSIPGKGTCKFYDAPATDLWSSDYCYFAPILKCPDSTWTRVACTPGCQSNCGSGSICTASTAANVYYFDDAGSGTNKFQSICCQKGSDFTCVSSAN
jgi:hypothetical protein